MPWNPLNEYFALSRLAHEERLWTACPSPATRSGTRSRSHLAGASGWSTRLSPSRCTAAGVERRLEGPQRKEPVGRGVPRCMLRRCTVPTAKWVRSQLSPLYSVTLAAVATEQALAVSPPADRGLVRVSELEDPHHLAHHRVGLGLYRRTGLSQGGLDQSGNYDLAHSGRMKELELRRTQRSEERHVGVSVRSCRRLQVPVDDP